MQKQQRISQSIKQKIKKSWQKAHNDRLLRAFYRRQNLIETRAPRFSHDLFVLGAILVLLFWFAPMWQMVWGGMIVVAGVLVVRRFLKRPGEDLRLKKACFQKIAEREFQKRLAQTPLEVLWPILQAEICKKYKIKNLEIKDSFLQGSLWGEKVAFVYLDVYGEEFVTTREVFAVVQKCLRQGISHVRIFTPGEFEPALRDEGIVSLLPFAVNLKFDNGEELQRLLKHTLLFPSVSEIKEIINSEKLKPQKKLSLLKKEVWQQKRITGYILYSCLLFFMAWLRLGVVYLNIIAGLLLLGFALVAVLKSFSLAEKRDNL